MKDDRKYVAKLKKLLQIGSKKNSKRENHRYGARTTVSTLASNDKKNHGEIRSNSKIDSK